MASIISAGLTSGTSLNLSGDTSGVLQLASNGSTTAVTIDTSQKVGIGTASPTGKLHVYGAGEVQTLQRNSGSANNYTLFKTEAGADQAYLGFSDTGVNDFAIFNVQNGYVRIGTNNTERMRVTSSGYVWASSNATYATIDGHQFSQSASGEYVTQFYARTATPFGILVRYSNADPNNADSQGFGFYNDFAGTWIYRIYSNGTVAARSDARWKKNVETTRDGYLEDVAQLRVVKYNWYNHEDTAPKELGFIAQEVEQVFPGLVQTDPVMKKREVIGKDGNVAEEEYQDGDSKSIKVSVLVPILVKAIQELKAELDATKAEVQALKGTL